MAIKHNFQSGVSDAGAREGDVKPSHWNEEHIVEGLLGALLNLAVAPDVLPYLNASSQGAVTPLTAFGRVLIALECYDALRTAMNAVAKTGDTMTGDLALGLHKITGLGTPTNPTDAVTKEYADALTTGAAGGLAFKGTWDASAGTFPGNTGRKVGWYWIVSVAGTVNGVSFDVGDQLFAIVDNASTSTYAANWRKVEGSISLAEVQAAVGFTFGSLAAASSVTAAQISNASANGRSLITAADYAAMRTLLGLGSAALLTAGTGINNVVQLDGSGKLPAVDGSALTNIGGTKNGLVGINVYTSSQTITIPAGATRCRLWMAGGGGGAPNLGTAGAAPGALMKVLTGLTPSNTLTFTRGAGGAATPTAGGASTLASGTQTISTLTANGGGVNNGGTSGGFSTGGTATGGDINITGQPGMSSPFNDGSVTTKAVGGVSGFGLVRGANADGSAGDGGILIVEWYS